VPAGHDLAGERGLHQNSEGNRRRPEFDPSKGRSRRPGRAQQRIRRRVGPSLVCHREPSGGVTTDSRRLIGLSPIEDRGIELDIANQSRDHELGRARGAPAHALRPSDAPRGRVVFGRVDHGRLVARSWPDRVVTTASATGRLRNARDSVRHLAFAAGLTPASPGPGRPRAASLGLSQIAAARSPNGRLAGPSPCCAIAAHGIMSRPGLDVSEGGGDRPWRSSPSGSLCGDVEEHGEAAPALRRTGRGPAGDRRPCGSGSRRCQSARR